VSVLSINGESAEMSMATTTVGDGGFGWTTCSVGVGKDGLQDCPHRPWGWHTCNHAMDAVIQCVSPPLWNIEWGFEDEKDKSNFVSGFRAYYVLTFKRVVTPNMFIKCWPMWKAREKVKIAIYTDDFFESENPPYLKANMFDSWIVGWLHKPWYMPYIYFYVDYAKCDMERIRAVQCDQQYEVPPDFQRSWCWESTPRMPEEYTLLQPTEPEVVPTTSIGRNFTELAHDIARNLVSAFHGDTFEKLMALGEETTHSSTPITTA